MPGTVRGELYEMAVEDALAILVLDPGVAGLYASAEEVGELRRAARTVIEAAAIDVIRRYAHERDVGLRVV